MERKYISVPRTSYRPDRVGHVRSVHIPPESTRVRPQCQRSSDAAMVEGFRFGERSIEACAGVREPRAASRELQLSMDSASARGLTEKVDGHARASCREGTCLLDVPDKSVPHAVAGRGETSAENREHITRSTI